MRSRILPLFAFCMLSSGYCLLAYVPFTYTQFIEARLVGWTSAFADLHPWLYWIVLGLFATTYRGVFVRGSGARAPRVLLCVLAAAGVALLVHPVLHGIASDRSALVLAIAALLPLAGVGIVDLVGQARDVRWGKAEAADDLRLLAVAAGSAALLALLNLALQLGSLAGTSFGEKAQAALASVAAHALAFCGVFLVLLLLRGMAGLSRTPARAEFLLGTLLLAAALAAAIDRLVLRALSVGGAPGLAYALAFGGSVALFVAGLALRLHPAQRGQNVRSGFALLLEPLGPRPGSPLWAVLHLCAIAGLAYAFVSSTAVMDWNHLLRRLTALAIWPLAWAWVEAVLPPLHVRAAQSVERLAVLGCCLLCAGLFRATQAGSAPASSVKRYADYDGSYGVIRDALARPAPGVGEERGFFDYLQKHTNISRSIHIDPVEVNLAPQLAPSPGPRPNIFVFVIDSLRQDYLSPYNPKVDFTPRIERFAQDGVVFENTFTHYGATGLSEPSIWAGGLLVHQQYVTPFHPMNSLEKLLQAEGYRRLVSLDSILRVLLPPSASLTDLDQGIPNKDYSFCRSLEALRHDIASRKEPGSPLFVYTQPQDIHVSVITREGASVPPGESYPGFYAPYASRIRRMDGCFGEFLEDLKARALYDESLIVLTSDHGDSLGEGGRWGHAYTLYPEIVRVPLLIKLPKSMQQSFHADPRAVTFTTDITPSLYELLSHPPALRGGLFGRPLFTRDRAEVLAPPAEGFLLASSYGPVYGNLDRDGRTLYVVDAINYEDWLFDIRAGGTAEQRPVSEELRGDRRRKIRSAISALHELYRTGELD